MKIYVRTIPFSKKDQMILKLSEFMCGCICTVRKKEWTDHCDFVDIEYQKRISHSQWWK